MLVGHVRIDLCSADAAMSEHTLHAPNVGAVHKQVGRKAVSHGVRTDMFGNTGDAGVF